MISTNYKLIKKILPALIVLIAISGCKKEIEDLELATFPSIAEVFIDGFGPGITDFNSYDPINGADVTTFSVVSDVVYQGQASMRFAIPDPDNPNGSFAGGAFIDNGGRDLSGFDALTFWAKGSKNAKIDLIGFGDDFAEGKFKTSLSDASINSNWRQYIIPIPDPSVLTQEKGMLFFSDGTTNDNGLGYTFWLDEVKFEKLGNLAQFVPRIQNGKNDTLEAETGQKITVAGLQQIVNLPSGVNQTSNLNYGYFTFSSSNPNVASVNNQGIVTVMDAGTATITAKLSGTEAIGSLTIESTGDPVLPATPAPAPTRNADSVIALWSNAYEERNVDTWNARYEFSNAEEDFIKIDGDDVIRYRDLNFVGIEFQNPSVDASEMTHIHLDIWTPDPTNPPNDFKVLLADGGANGKLGGGDDTNFELTFTSPTLMTENWFSLDIPLSSFTGLASRSNLVQMVLSGSLPNVFVDNVYFYIAKEEIGGGDCTPLDPNMTTSFPIDFENCENLSGVFEAGDGVTGFPTSNPDKSGMNTSDRVYQFNKVLGSAWYSGIFHIFPSAFDMTDNKVFKTKIWSPKANVIVRFQIEKEGGGAVTYQKTATIESANTWTELSFDFSDQPLIDGFTVYDKIVIIPDDQDNGPADGSIYYLDDIELTTGSSGGGAIPPTSDAPDPTQDSENVISIYSDVYTDVPNEGFNRYGAAAFEDAMLTGGNALKYTFADVGGGNFQVIELGGGNQLDIAAEGMTNFRFDLWFPNEGVESEEFLLKVVDFSVDPATTASITINSVSNPAIAQGQWLQFDFTLAELAALGMTSTGGVQQVVIDLLSSGEVYVDNIYFYKEGGSSGPIPPTSDAPDPTQNPENVISIYSDVYTDVPNEGYNRYGAAAFEDVMLTGGNALKYTFADVGGGNFQVIELGGGNQLDIAAEGMTNFRFDLWFPNEGVESEQFLLKVVDFSVDPATTASITINSASNPAIAQGQWLQFDFTLAELAAFGMTSTSGVQQVVIDLLSSGEVYVDNIYFYKKGETADCDPPMDAGNTTSFPIDFEDCENLSGVFEAGDGVTGFPSSNPDKSGINMSDRVYQFNKVEGAAWYSGIFHIFPSNFDMTTNKVFKMKIWSPKDNIIVRFQIEKEGSGGTIVTYIVRQTLTTANAWTELTFDFSGEPFTTGTDVYDKIVIIPDDAGDMAPPADGSVYYIDDIILTN